MEPTQQNLSFEESVKQVMQTLPPLIRRYIEDGEYTKVAKRLMATYKLRIDQAGVLEREVLLLLMGVDNPDEFVQALAEDAKLDQQTINNITKDVNDQVFVPLREQMQKGGGEQKEEKKVPPPPNYGSQQPINSTLEPKTTMIPANPQLPSVAARPSARPSLYTGRSATPAPIPFIARRFPTPIQSPVKTIAPAREGDQTSFNPAKLLADHEEPSINLDVSTSSQSISRITPPVARTSPPPNLPGQMMPAFPRPTPNPVSQAVKPQIPRPPATPYTADPYREPIDEK